jgi:hypothetical protein
MTNQDAIRIIKTAIAEVEWEYPMEYAAAFDKAIEALEQESETGRWIKLPYMAIEADGTLLFAHVCSSCNGIGYFRKSSGKIVGGLYCPNCGSMMNIKADSEVTE